MADAGVGEALGDALLELVQQSTSRAAPHVRSAVAWLREHAQPPQGTRLISPDGGAYTGVAVVDRNNVVVLIAARSEGFSPSPSPRPPMVTAPRQPQRFFEPDPDPGDGWPPDDPFLRR